MEFNLEVLPVLIKQKNEDYFAVYLYVFVFLPIYFAVQMPKVKFYIV